MKHVMALALAFALVVGAFAAPAPQGTTAGSSTATKKKAARQDVCAERFEPAQSK